MFLKALSLRRFRSYDSAEIAPAAGLNLLVGGNGAGKSNLLEAISVLAAGDSHRGAETKNCFLREKDDFTLAGSFDGEESVLLDLHQQRGRPRQVKLNNAYQKRLRDWVGRVPIVSFSPEDLGLVKGEPSVRRKTLNDILVQDGGAAVDVLQRYNKVLEERNAALKAVQEGRAAPGSLEPWDLALLKEGAALSLIRQAFIALFSPIVADRHGTLSRDEDVRLAYKPSLQMPSFPTTPRGGFPEGEEPFRESLLNGTGDRVAEVVAGNRRRLQDLRDGEIATGTSLIGPHRDDMEIFLGEQPARAFASQGQQRALAIAFKFAERAYLKSRLQREPICLMDDMFSELDPARRRGLTTLLSEGAQCFVTLTSPEDWPLPDGLSAAAAVFEIGDGRVMPAAARV